MGEISTISFGTTRRVMKIAATWYRKRTSKRGLPAVSADVDGAWQPLDVAGISLRMFRRAYVVAWLRTRPLLSFTRNGNVALHLGGKFVACAHPGGGCWFRAGFSPSLAPHKVNELARQVVDAFEGALSQELFRSDESAGILGFYLSSAFRHTWQRFCGGLVQKLVRDFSLHVDPRALGTFRHLGSLTTTRLARWLMHPNATLRLRRSQAARAYPAIIVWLHDTGRTRDGRCRKCAPRPGRRRGGVLCAHHQVAIAIDRAHELLPHVASALSTPVSNVRRWGAVTVQRLGRDGLERIPDMVRLTAAVGSGSWYPIKRADFRVLSRFVTVELFRAAALNGLSIVRCLNSADASRWRDYAWVEMSALAGLNAMTQSAFNVLAFAPAVRAAAGGPRKRYDALLRALLNDVQAALLQKSFRSLLLLSERWHDAEAASRLARDAYVQTRSWAPVAESFEHAGARLVELTDNRMLAAEGRALDHCVGDYQVACLRGQARILSVRDEQGASLSTVEIYVESQRVRVAQHFGIGNAAPPARAVRALQAWLAAIEEGRVHVDLVWPNLLPQTHFGGDAMAAFWQNERELPKRFRDLLHGGAVDAYLAHDVAHKRSRGAPGVQQAGRM